MVCWGHFPDHKGRVTGLIISGFGFGSTVFNLISTHIINPDNKKPTHKHNGTKYFSDDISSHLPSALQILSLCYLLISIIGILLLGKINKKNSNISGNIIKDECPNVITGICTKHFIVLFILGYLSNMPGLYIITAYKSFGSLHINDDSFLALVGALGSFFNGSFRFVWAQFMDKTSFKLAISGLLILQLGLIGSLYYICYIKSCFLIWICGIYSCEGGLATLFPSVIAKCFGQT